MRKMFIMGFLALISCSSPAVPATEKQQVVERPSNQTPRDAMIPTGCGDSQISVDGLKDHGFHNMVIGIDENGVGVILYANRDTHQLILINFKNDQSSCVVAIINDVKFLPPPKE